MAKKRIAGLIPWLPWPLSRWRLWTEPVRAERLAALRIGLAFVLLVDICTTYGPHVTDFYGPDSLSRVGERDVFGYVIRGGSYAGPDRDNTAWFWSLWRGVDHPANFGFALVAWVFLSGWIICRLTEGARPQAAAASWPWLVGGWMVCGTLALLGFWRSAATLPDTVTVDVETSLQLGAAFVGLACASVFLFLDKRPRRGSSAGADSLLVTAVFLACVFVIIAIWQFVIDWITDVGPDLSWLRLDMEYLLAPWQTNSTALRILVILWGCTTFLLLIGCWTRLSAILSWILMTSFDNLNHYNIDSGETVRYIVFFYVLFTPCGAVWSVDSWRRGDRDRRPLYVSPWWLRLMFLQLIFIYFVNGLYKLSGDSWHEGTSLYHVLASLDMSRFALSQLPVTFPILQLTTWLVIAWEVSFPLLVLFRWTRVPALIMGALFHLGILVTMEIGFFAPYMLCFYLPMVPWERWSRRREEDASGPERIPPAQAREAPDGFGTARAR
jgi:hypothetical protein